MKLQVDKTLKRRCSEWFHVNKAQVVDINLELIKGKKGFDTNHSLKVDKDFGEDDLNNETKNQSLESIEKEPPKK